MAINLLPQNLEKAQKQGRQQAVASAVSVAFLIILISVVAILFSYRVFVTRQFNDASAKVDQLTADLSKFKNVEGIIKAIHLKTNKVNEIFTKHYPYGDVLEDLRSHTGSEIEIVRLNLQTQDRFSVTGATNTLPDLANYIKYLDEDRKEYADVSITDIKFNTDDFRYEFTVNFKYVPTAVTVAGG